MYDLQDNTYTYYLYYDTVSTMHNEQSTKNVQSTNY